MRGRQPTPDISSERMPEHFSRRESQLPARQSRRSRREKPVSVESRSKITLTCRNREYRPSSTSMKAPDR